MWVMRDIWKASHVQRAASLGSIYPHIPIIIGEGADQGLRATTWLYAHNPHFQFHDCAEPEREMVKLEMGSEW